MPRLKSTHRSRKTADSLGGLQAFSYDQYVRAEWALLAANPGRTAVARTAVANLAIARVLDIGCGAGQELRAFLDDPRTLGVGIDVSIQAGQAGRKLFAAQQPCSHVCFMRAAAEDLPFGAASFDLVICRLALPYTDNSRTLSEIARVLRPGGALLLTFHHARYYTIELRDALIARNVKRAIHACRVLVAGTLYHLTGSQPRSALSGGETFQTMWLLRRELRRHGLAVRSVLADSVPAAPSVLIDRNGQESAATPAVRS